MSKNSISRKIKIKMAILMLLSLIVIAPMLFWPAGTLYYWQGWIFMGIIFIPCFCVIAYFVKHDPALLVRRMQYHEKESKQKIIVYLSGLLFFIGFIIPGFDFRFGWSHIPTLIVIASDILILLGYILVFLVFKENSYTSRIIEVVKGQKVISTGPYAIIRHPMYAGVLTMYIFMPLALGSYFALPLFLPIIGLIMWRIIEEEKVLKKDLKGYIEYTKKVKFRLIPGLW